MRLLFVSVIFASAASSANAWEFRCRFVERIGTTDVVLPGNEIPGFEGPRNIRIQFGVFDDVNGPAPAGGFVGWNVGAISVSGFSDNSNERRTPGRLAPFNFATQPNANGNPPLPAGDPFDALTEIDATLGTQSPIWACDASGNPNPQPQAVVRGRNTFVSVYALRIEANGFFFNSYDVTVSGNLIAASSWREIGSPTPPDCGNPADPTDDISGQVVYAPFPEDPRSITASLHVLGIPGAGSASLFAVGGLFAVRRRR